MGFSFKKILPAVGAAVGLPFVGSTALALGSSALDFVSAQQQNKSAETMAKDSMGFSALQAQRQMDFQERMSSTAHQREVEDLRAAGLNPLLSVNSGASAPGGAAGSGAQASLVPELSAITSSAKDMVSLYAQYKASMAASRAADAQAVKSGAESDLLKKRNPEAELDERFYKFFNSILDRFGNSSAKQHTINNWFDPNRNELDEYIESPTR